MSLVKLLENIFRKAHSPGQSDVSNRNLEHQERSACELAIHHSCRKNIHVLRESMGVEGGDWDMKLVDNMVNMIKSSPEIHNEIESYFDVRYGSDLASRAYECFGKLSAEDITEMVTTVFQHENHSVPKLSDESALDARQ